MSPEINQAQESQVERTADFIHRTLPDWLESYLVVGRDPVTGKPLARYWAPTKESAQDLNELLLAVLANGGVKWEGEE